jgi:hypothetical protein
MTLESLAVWVVLAFALWLALTLPFGLMRLDGRTAAAALVSWLAARVAITFVPRLIAWLERHH